MTELQVLLPRIGAALAILLISSLLLIPAIAASVPIEQTIANRYSVDSWKSDNILSSQLIEVLQNSYGYRSGHRSVQKIGSDYSLTIFVANNSGTYRYDPEQNTLVVHDLGVKEATLATRFQQTTYPGNAPALIVIVWNQTRMNNQHYAWTETGFVVQNMYLAAIALNLGTHCVGLIDSLGLRADLKLPTTMTPLIMMPIGYPTRDYTYASPDNARATRNLPPVQFSQMGFDDALSHLLYAQSWSNKSLSTQELSQLLWAAYGYSSTSHRTVPSAGSVYPLKILVLNATGTFEYNPETHSVTTLFLGDKRTEIASVSNSQKWAANAPAIFLVAYDSNGAGSYGHPEWFELEAGLVTQDFLLEATAWDLSGNIVSNGLETWNGAGAASIRSILGLSSSIIPLYIIPIGHDGQIPEFSPLPFFAFLIIMSLGIVVFYRSYSQRKAKGKNVIAAKINSFTNRQFLNKLYICKIVAKACWREA